MNEMSIFYATALLEQCQRHIIFRLYVCAFVSTEQYTKSLSTQYLTYLHQIYTLAAVGHIDEKVRF